MKKFFVSQTLIIFCLFILNTSLYAEVRYNVTNLSDYGFTGVSDINNSGQAVGQTSQGGAVWDPLNGIQYIGSIAGASSTSAHAINDLGQVVGTCRIGNDIHILTWDSINGMQDLGVKYNVLDINNNGQIIGNYFFRDPINGYTDFTDYGVEAINNQGQVLLSNGYTNKVALYHNNTITTLLEGISIGVASASWDINDLGQITGLDYVNDIYCTLLYDISTQLLQYVNIGQESQGNSINNLGQVVGWSRDGGFLYENNEVLFLDNLVSENLNVNFVEALKITDSGQILAYGNSDNQFGFYYLTPVAVPEPSAMALSFLGLVWLIRRKFQK